MLYRDGILRTGLFAVVFCAACGASVSTTSPSSVRNISAQRVQGPYVPAGQRFAIQMETSLDTMASAVGTPFTATVENALVGPNGVTVVPAGAKVRGRIVSTGSVTDPRLKLELNSIETASGPAPIEAKVRHAERNVYAGPPVFVPTYDDPYLYPYDAYAWGWRRPYGGVYGGGPAYVPYTPREIHIPRGASIQLELTRPLIPPNTRVVPAG